MSSADKERETRLSPSTQGDPDRLARWDALAHGLRDGGIEGFVRAYGRPQVPEGLQDTVLRSVHWPPPGLVLVADSRVSGARA